MEDLPNNKSPAAINRPGRDFKYSHINLTLIKCEFYKTYENKWLQIDLADTENAHKTKKNDKSEH